MRKHSQYFIYFLLFLLLIIPTSIWANDKLFPPQKSLFTTLSAQKMNRVKMTLDINRYVLEKLNPKEKEQKVAIQFSNEEGVTMNMKVKISPRGVYRRQFCDFPPMRLNFSKRRLRKKGFKGKFDKYKLVTHCMDSEESNQAVLKEYAVYKMYNQLTPESFKVLLLQITYQDIQDKDLRIDRVAFLIEKNDEMAARLGGRLVEKFGLSPKEFTKKSYQNALVFNYMIGNLDSDIRVQQNLKYIQIKKKQPLILVPYDFDFCSLVAPEYITLNSNYNQNKLKERFPTGKFEDEDLMWQTIEKFQKARAYFIKCCTKVNLLERSEKRKVKKYLISFYKILEDEEKLEEVFMSK